MEAGAEIQQARGFPDAALGRGSNVQQQFACGMVRGNGAQRIGDTAENDGQFIVEIVSGCGSYGAGAIGSGKVFHSRMLHRKLAGAAAKIAYQLEFERNTATKINVNAS
jgi:hypothetical protein